MSTVIRSAVLALVVAAGASSAMAQSSRYDRYDNNHRYGNSQQSDRAFWDQQQRDSQ